MASISPCEPTALLRKASAHKARQGSQPPQTMKNTEPLTVGQFFAAYADKLSLQLEGPKIGFDRIIREPTVNRPGLALVGFFEYFAFKRIQVLGAAELSYLQYLPVAERRQRLEELFKKQFPCLVIARNAKPPKDLAEIAMAAGIPVFRTPMITMKFINAATLVLDIEFSPTASEYGCMVDIMGIGVLIRGPSGIGKSECVLGLIERGYSLVSDDITKFRLLEGRELIGTSHPLSRFHMEVRGIGIIDVAATFGVGAVRSEKRLDLVVTLAEWEQCSEVDRVGLDTKFYEILGIKIPEVTIPVRMGRDLARLVEVAALDRKLKAMGHSAALCFNNRLIDFIHKKGSGSSGSAEGALTSGKSASPKNPNKA